MSTTERWLAIEETSTGWGCTREGTLTVFGVETAPTLVIPNLDQGAYGAVSIVAWF